MPLSANAIIRIEDVVIENAVARVTVSQAKVFQNIAQKGEDASTGEALLEKGTLIEASDLTMIASLGYAQLKVFKKPNITVGSSR